MPRPKRAQRVCRRALSLGLTTAPPPLLSPSAAAGRGQRPQSAEPEEPLTLGAAWRAGRGAEGRVPRGTRARRSPPPAVFLLSESGAPGSPPVCAEWSDTLPPQRLRRGSPGLEPRPSPTQPREPPARTPCSPGSGALCLSSARAHRAARVSGLSFWKPSSPLSRTVWCLPPRSDSCGWMLTVTRRPPPPADSRRRPLGSDLRGAGAQGGRGGRTGRRTGGDGPQVKVGFAEAEGDGESVERGRGPCRSLGGAGPGTHWPLAGTGSARRGGRPEEPPLSV